MESLTDMDVEILDENIVASIDIVNSSSSNNSENEEDLDIGNYFFKKKNN